MGLGAYKNNTTFIKMETASKVPMGTTFSTELLLYHPETPKH